ncbi:MAG: hypothetical protein K8R88_08810 [Armatimonadetes bacterium]|nr:hypothetical protein [Armatimonadota bacterium]
MRKLLVLFTLLATTIAFADHWNTMASWSGWKISTGEESWFGKRHTSYPIWQMFDRDPKTAWVYSGTFADPMKTKSVGEKVVSTRLRTLEERAWIQILPRQPVVVSEVRIMTGYNKDLATFQRNARILRLDIFESNQFEADDHKIKSVQLSDKMGWHKISLPRKKYDCLRFVVREISHGSDPDIAISEVRLMDGARDVGPPKTGYALYSDGDECGCGGTTQFLRKDGKLIAQTLNIESQVAASSDGRYVAGFDRLNTTQKKLWIFNIPQRKFVVQKNLTEKESRWILAPYWTNDNRLLSENPVDFHSPEPPRCIWKEKH